MWKKTKVLKSLLLVFTGKIYLQEFQFPETGGRGGNKAELPLVEKGSIREYLNKPNAPMPMDLATYTMRRNCGGHCKAAPDGDEKVMGISRDSLGLEKSKFHSYLQE